MARHHHGRHLTAAGAGVAAPGVAVALVEEDRHRVVALGPEGGIRDLAHGAPERGIPRGDEVLVLGVRATRAAGIDAVGRVPVHVVALVGDDVAEGGDPARRQVPAQLLRGHLTCPVPGIPGSDEVLDRVVLGDVEGIDVRSPVALDRVADAREAGMGKPLEVGLPRDVGGIELADQAGGCHGLHPVRVVAGDTKGAAAQEGHVVGLARVRHTEVLSGEPELTGQCVEVRRRRVADDVGEAVVLLDDHEDVVVAGHTG